MIVVWITKRNFLNPLILSTRLLPSLHLLIFAAVEKFIVSALKYRPQNFATVVGQQHITTTLKNAIRQNTLAHAFLFCGPRGVGKTTCARILAKTINCENLQPDGEACNQCHSCVSFNEGTSLNIHELDAASNNSVEDIRELVNQVRFAPQEGKYKIYIIDEVHMLSSSAFNAFLKTLEEPPHYAKFILATTEKHKILPTILSRCQIFDFKRITNADTVEHLQEIVEKEHTKAEKAALQLIAQKSEGCMRDSLSMLDKIVSFTGGELTYKTTLEHLNLLDEDYYFKLLEALQQQDLAATLLLYDQINRKGFEGDTVLNGFASCIRNLMVSKDERAAQLLDVLEGLQDKYAAMAKEVSLSFLISALNVLSEAESSFRIARNKRLHVELCLIKLCYLQQAIEMAVSQEGEVIKKKRVDGPVAVRSVPLEPLQLKKIPDNAAGGATLKVETGKLHPTNEKEVITTVNKELVRVPTQPQTTPAAVIPTKEAVYIPPVINTTAPEGRKLSLIEQLKEKQQQDMAARGLKQERLLVMEEVKTLWDNYTQSLKVQQKHSAVTSFQLANLSVNENELIIGSVSTINQKFIEGEATSLLEVLKAHFQNNNIRIRFLLEEDSKEPKILEPKYLNSTERYKMMAEEYPLVRELKEKLKLELKY
ncbi:DNA polymerase III subunit gamma/tau [soil metagenome]